MESGICLSSRRPSPSALGVQPCAIEKYSPFLRRCHGVGLGSIEVVVPREGADGHSGGGCGGDIESSALGGLCLARCGCGAL